MGYSIALTEPQQMDGVEHYGVNVKNDNGVVIYTEYFPDAFHADRHADRIAELLKIVAKK